MDNIAKKILFCVFLCFYIPLGAFAQGLDIPFLFKTGLRTQVTYTPIQADSNLNMQINHYQVQGIFSLKSNINANFSLKKFDIGIKQNFLTINVGMRVVNMNFSPENKANYWANLTLGYTSIKAGIRNGIWVRTLQVGAVQDVEDLGNTRPFVLGAVAKVFILGLRKQNIFGLGVAYTPQGRILPVPIIGFNRKLSDKWDMNLLIPASIAFIWKTTNKLKIRCRLNPNALQVGSKNLPYFAQNNTQNPQITQANRLQYTQFETNLSMQYQLNKNTRIVAQAGYLIGSNLNFNGNNTKIGEIKLGNGFPQFTFGFHFNLSDGFLGSQMFMAD